MPSPTASPSPPTARCRPVCRCARPFGVYVHVPFCATRCGYCDFNTYTGLESLHGGWADAAVAEVRLARRCSARSRSRRSSSAAARPRCCRPPTWYGCCARSTTASGSRPGAEVTTEANPDSVTPASLAELRAGGFTRVSFGMQSASSHVLRTLDRTHTPGRPQQAVREAFAAGFEQVSLDLIYGTPGESDDDWRRSLAAVREAGPTHVSAYALIVEEGTALGRDVARGVLPAPDDDVLADRYLLAESALADLGWYEVSNWGEPCRHNLGYWRGRRLVGRRARGAQPRRRGALVEPQAPGELGRGAGDRLARRRARAAVGAEDRRVERVLLEVRLREGLPLDVLLPAGLAAARQQVADGLLEPGAYERGRAVLTLRGRLLADAVVRDLVD